MVLGDRRLLVAVVLLDVNDSAGCEAVVRDAPRSHSRAGAPRPRVDGQLATPGHPRQDGVATGDVVAYVICLLGEQFAQVRSLDERRRPAQRK
jgi:hypothetical protein